MKVIYTKSAQNELERFHSVKEKQLEDIIRREKYVLGDEVIEITAADIKKAERKFYVAESNFKKPLTSMLLKAYSVLGLLMIIGGFFYNELKILFEGDPIQQMLVLSGLALSLASLIANYFLKLKRQRMEMHENKYEDIVSKLRDDT
ncbi:MAG: hypothetical protein WD097_08320 [Balneolales bacterium]